MASSHQTPHMKTSQQPPPSSSNCKLKTKNNDSWNWIEIVVGQSKYVVIYLLHQGSIEVRRQDLEGLSCTEFYTFLVERGPALIDEDEHLCIQGSPEVIVPISGQPSHLWLPAAIYEEEEWYFELKPGRIPTGKLHNNLNPAPASNCK